ncbi:MAG: hypothetical protein JXR95_14125 [Deltaproteobacteria bacterium]|nr:hypothetical protein [Deltaproteobacteria bacterium]
MRRSLLFSLAAVLFVLSPGCDFQEYNFGDKGHWELPDGSLPDIVVDPDADVIECEPTDEICDGKDNDCDDVIDNGFDLQNDPANCGECNHICNFPYAVTSCVEGECVMGDCYPGHFDNNGSDVDGCEYGCFVSNEGVELCDGIDNDCNGEIDEDFDLETDPTNCGACSNTCVFLNGNGACEGGECKIGYCVGGYVDADGSPDNGCECHLDLTEGTVTECIQGETTVCASDEVCADVDGDSISHCSAIPLEICDGKDNDCDGLVDGADDLVADTRVGITCFGDPDGICGSIDHSGATECIDGLVVCAGPNLLYANDVPETCNGLDDDCDGVIDDSPVDAGASCGTSSNYPCSLGTMLCTGGVLSCVGAIEPGVETCNLIDDDCNGNIDDNLTDVGGACNVPVDPPVGATSPCQAGTLQCVAGGVQCVGSVGPTSTTDSCGDDSNCDGILTNQPDLNSNPYNCGSCGHNCYAGTEHSIWTCESGTCVYQGCEAGYYDLDPVDNSCEYPCLYNGTETCNGIDDDCNGIVDDGLTAPSPVDVCGVSPAATAPECTTNVSVQCTGGTWQCTFPANVCNPTCSTATDICDTLDNNCNGNVNETFPNYGKECKSDDGLPYPGHGACQTSGTFVCDGTSAVVCSATKGSCEPNCEELCDGIDNDCDGLVDEYKNTNSGDSYYVKPQVALVNGVYIMSYEASRNNASDVSAGIGNGYTCASGCSTPHNAPAGVPLDSTVACSVPDRLPWFNVSPVEVEQTCELIGGRICTTDEWIDTCEAGSGCDWGYASSCTSPSNSSRYCNLGNYDFDDGLEYDQDGLLTTASPDLLQCRAELGTYDAYDITGNLREITYAGIVESEYTYSLMGGSFMTQDEDGAMCTFDFYVVDEEFQLWDTGFRCCFDTDPR